MLGPYRVLAALPGLPRLLVWTLLGRLHLTATPLALTFLMAGWTGSYLPGGVVGGAYTIGVTIGSPVRGRAADAGDAARLLRLTGVGYGLAMAGVAVLPSLAPGTLWPVVAAIALAAGVAQPPVGQIARASWPRFATGAALHSLYTVETTVGELIFIAGPLLAALVVALVDARAATLGVAALAVVGAYGFAAALHRMGPPPRAERGTRATGTLLRTHGIAPAIAMVLFAFAPLTTLDVTIVAFGRNHGSSTLAGVLVAVWAIGSGVGGAITGGFAGAPRMTVRYLAMSAGMALPVPLLTTRWPAPSWLVAVVLAVGGTAVAPAIASITTRVGELAPPGRGAETFGWLTAAATAGGALSLPVAGWLLDHAGPSAAAGLAAGLAAVAALLSLRVPRPGPDREDTPSAAVQSAQ